MLNLNEPPSFGGGPACAATVGCTAGAVVAAGTAWAGAVVATAAGAVVGLRAAAGAVVAAGGAAAGPHAASRLAAAPRPPQVIRKPRRDQRRVASAKVEETSGAS